MNLPRLAAVALVLFLTKDASGAVTPLVLHQGGRDIPGKRLK